MTSNVEARFGEALRHAYEASVRLCGCGKRALQKIRKEGPVKAVKQFIKAAIPGQGFKRLHKAGRLDLSVEAIACRPEFASLFTPEELERARNRLLAHGYDPDAY